MSGETNPPVPDPTELTTDQLLREVANLERWCTALVEGNEKVTQEKFKSVDTQLRMIEHSRIEQKADAAVQLQAALTASTEQISAVVTALGDLKERVNKVENVKLGATENRTGIYAAIGCAVGFIGLLVVVMNMLPGN